MNPTTATGAAAARSRPGPNARLRRAMVTARVGQSTLVAITGVNPKTVQRWLGGRVPHPRHRLVVAEALRCTEVDLWPEITLAGVGHGIHAAYPTRAGVPGGVWLEVIAQATSRVCLLDEHGLHVLADRRLRAALAQRLATGVRLQVCLTYPGPTGPVPPSAMLSARSGPPRHHHAAAVASPVGVPTDGSGRAEGQDGVDPARELWRAQTRLGLQRLHELRAAVPHGHPGVEIGLRPGRLGLSLLGTDHDLLITHRLPETDLADGPTLHLRLPPAGAPVTGTLASAYLEAWDSAWTAADHR